MYGAMTLLLSSYLIMYYFVLHCFWLALVVVVCSTMFLSVKVLFWCACMAINNVGVQYNGGLLPDIMLLT